MNKRQAKKRSKEIDKRVDFILGKRNTFLLLDYNINLSVCYSRRYKPFKDYVKSAKNKPYLVGIDLATSKDFSVRTRLRLVPTPWGVERIYSSYEVL